MIFTPNIETPKIPRSAYKREFLKDIVKRAAQSGTPHGSMRQYVKQAAWLFDQIDEGAYD